MTALQSQPAKPDSDLAKAIPTALEAIAGGKQEVATHTAAAAAGIDQSRGDVQAGQLAQGCSDAAATSAASAATVPSTARGSRCKSIARSLASAHR